MTVKKNDSYEILKNNKKLKYIFLFIFFIIIASLLLIFKHYLWPFLFAVIMYIPLRPINEKLKKLFKNKTLSTTILIFILFLLIFIPLFLLFSSLAAQTYQLYLFLENKISVGLIKELQAIPFISEIISKYGINTNGLVEKGVELAQKTAGSAFSSITAIISFPINFAINFFFMILILFFLLKDGQKLDEVVYKTLPFPDDIEAKVIKRLKEVIKILLAGNMFIMSLQGIVIGTGLYFAGINMPLLWGSIAAILSLIPVIGTVIIWLPAVIYLIIIKSYLLAIFLGVWSFVGYLILENLVKPKIFGERLNFHPLLFFFLLLGSIQSLGLPGVILGPILLTLFYSFWEIYKVLGAYGADQ
jgi:predicted PurR-regulated permease PerM